MLLCNGGRGRSLADLVHVFEEVDEALVDLRAAGCDLITITQYLRPTPRHHPVERWVAPDDFVAWADRARAIGFAGVMSGPLVRSSLASSAMLKCQRPSSSS